MNYYQKQWLPELQVRPSTASSGRLRGSKSLATLPPGFTYNGFMVQPIGGAVVRRERPRTASAQPAGRRPTRPIPPQALEDRPVWQATNSPFDRCIPRLKEQPRTTEGQRALRRIASADVAKQRERAKRAEVARRGAQYAQSMEQHRTRAALLASIRKREKYLGWTQSTLLSTQVPSKRDMRDRRARRKLSQLREDVLALLSSLTIATVEVLEAIVAWREAHADPRIVPVWGSLNYLTKLEHDTRFLEGSQLLEWLAIAPSNSKVLPYIDEFASTQGAARFGADDDEDDEDAAAGGGDGEESKQAAVPAAAAAAAGTTPVVVPPSADAPLAGSLPAHRRRRGSCTQLSLAEQAQVSAAGVGAGGAGGAGGPGGGCATSCAGPGAVIPQSNPHLMRRRGSCTFEALQEAQAASAAAAGGSAPGIRRGMAPGLSSIADEDSEGEGGDDAAGDANANANANAAAAAAAAAAASQAAPSMPAGAAWLAALNKSSDKGGGAATTGGPRSALQEAEDRLALTAARVKEIPAQLQAMLATNWTRVIDLFKQFDTNGDGVISKKEFLTGMKMLGLEADMDDVSELFRAFDEDDSGAIDFEELNKLLRAGNTVEIKDSVKDKMKSIAKISSVTSSWYKERSSAEARQKEERERIRKKWLPAHDEALTEAEQAYAQWVSGAAGNDDSFNKGGGGGGKPDHMELLAAGASLLKPRELLARVRAAESLLAHEAESPPGIRVQLVLGGGRRGGGSGGGGGGDESEQLDAYAEDSRRRANMGLAPHPPSAQERRHGRAAVLVQLMLKGAAIVIQTHYRLYRAVHEALQKQLNRRRNSMGGGGSDASKLSTGARRRLIELWMKNHHGMSAARRIHGGFKAGRRGSMSMAGVSGLALLGLAGGGDDDDGMGDEELDDLATLMQKAWRGFAVRKQLREEDEARQTARNGAAARLQARQRGRQERRLHLRRVEMAEERRTQREDAMEEALAALEARWQQHQQTDPARVAIYAVRRRTLQKSMDRIEAHVRRVQERQPDTPLRTSDVVALVAEFASGLFDDDDDQKK